VDLLQVSEKMGCVSDKIGSIHEHQKLAVTQKGVVKRFSKQKQYSLHQEKQELLAWQV